MTLFQFRIQGFLLGAALGEYLGTGLLDTSPIYPAQSKVPVTLPYTQSLLEILWTGLQVPGMPWNWITAQTQDLPVYLNAAVLPLLYPGSPSQLMSDWRVVAPQHHSVTLKEAIELSYCIATALHNPMDLLTFLKQSQQPKPWLATIFHGVLRTPTNYQVTLQQVRHQLPGNTLALTLTGALSGSLNTIHDFPLKWLASLSERPCPVVLGKFTALSWLEIVHLLSDRCLSRWSGQLPSPAGATVAQPPWSTIAVASANQLRRR
jgi:hypothetical protein